MKPPKVDLHRGLVLLLDDGFGSAWDVATGTPGPLMVGPLCRAARRQDPLRPARLASPDPQVKNLVSCGNLLFGPLDLGPPPVEPPSGALAGWRLLDHVATYYWAKTHGELPMTHMLIESLEAFLHPQQQLGMLLVLARAVRDGLRVVVTTASLTVVYGVNNLVQAARLGDRSIAGIPLPEVRLPRDKVAAYHCVRGEAPRDVVDPETGFISEGVLGETSSYLQDEMNLICRYLPS